MFTGIIETLGKVRAIQNKGSNRIFIIESNITSALKISDSIAINGCCLTVIKKEKETFAVEAISETYRSTNLISLQKGDYVNLERALTISNRLDGHLVQGHIDEVAPIVSMRKTSDWVAMEIRIAETNRNFIVSKGSIAVDGISLTVAKCNTLKFTTNIIPFTYEHTNLKYKKVGDMVNLEFDIIAKYLKQYIQQRYHTLRRNLS